SATSSGRDARPSACASRSGSRRGATTSSRCRSPILPSASCHAWASWTSRTWRPASGSPWTPRVRRSASATPTTCAAWRSVATGCSCSSASTASRSPPTRTSRPSCTSSSSSAPGASTDMTLATLALTIALAGAAPAGSAPATAAPAASAPAITPPPARPTAAAREKGPDRIETRVPTMPRLTVGDRFFVSYVVTTEHPSLVTGPLADTMGAFVVVKQDRKTARRGDLDETTYKLGIACFEPGRQTLPGLRFTVSFGSRGDTLTGDTVAVTIASVLPDSMKDVRALKPPETFPNYWAWLVPAIVLLVVILAWLAWKLARRLRRLHEALPPPLPPWEEALAALDRLPWRDWL